VTRSLQPILLALVAALALAVGACGGGGDEASSDTDVNTLLKDTFKGNKDVKSGKLNLALKVDAKGGTSSTQGPLNISVSGPFQTEGKQKLPKFDIDFAFEGAGQSIKAGLTSTGTKGFVNFQGTDYAVSDQVFQQFKAGYEQAQKNGTSKQKQQSLSSLGLDPQQWLTNPKNEGDAKVGDEDVIKITGGIDVNKLLDDVNTALSKVKQLGAQGTQNLPSQLTAEQRKQVTDAIKDPKVEIYTGKEDKILRRMVVSHGIFIRFFLFDSLLGEAFVAPMATGDAYCTVIDACAELFDVTRCRAWTDSFARWCDTQQELVLYRGHCFLHRAELLTLLGPWPAALEEARCACDRLAAP